MIQYAIISAYFLAAVTLPLTFIFMLWGLFRVTGQRGQSFFWSCLIGSLGFIPVLTDIRTPRGEIVDGIQYDVWIPPSIIQFLAEWGARGLIYLILGFSLVVIIKSISSKNIEKRAGGWLFGSYLFLITPSFISVFAGTRPFFSHFMVYAPLIFTLAYLTQPSPDWMRYIKQFKLILLLYISLSAVFGVIAPAWTTSSALTLIPGFNFRLHGIFSHSNNLGMAALVYLVLDLADGTRSTFSRKLAWLISVSVLVAAQSKTSWAGAVMAYGVFILYKIYAMKANNEARSFNPSIIFGLIGLIELFIIGWISLEKIINNLDSNTYNSLTSLTGRTNIWTITIRSWQDNPIFGYGPALWDVEYRLQYAPKYLLIAGMAHNQFFQTLGESGLLGVIGLFVYVGTLIVFGIRYFSITRGVSLALVVVLIARSIAETPFRNQTLDLMFFVHFAVFVLFLSLAANTNKQQTLGVRNQ